MLAGSHCKMITGFKSPRELMVCRRTTARWGTMNSFDLLPLRLKRFICRSGKKFVRTATPCAGTAKIYSNNGQLNLQNKAAMKVKKAEEIVYSVSVGDLQDVSQEVL